MSREVDASEPVSALADQDPTAADIAASLLSSPQQSFSACLSQGQKQQQADAELDAVAGEAGQPKQQQQPHCSLAPGPAAPEMQSEITAVQENRPDHGQVEAGRHPDGVAPLRPTQHTGSGPTACVLQVPATPAAPSPAAAHRPLAALSTSVKVRDRRCSLWRVFLRRRTACHGGSSSSSAHGSGVVRDSWECSEGMRPSVEAGHDGSSCGSSAASGASCSSNGSGRRGWWWSGRGSSHADDDPFDVESVDTFFDRPSYNLDMELSALGLQHQEQPHDQQDPKGVSPRAASYGADAVAGAGAVAGGDGQPQGSSRVILTGRWGWKDGGGALRRWGSMSGAASSPRSGVGAGTGGPGAVAVQLVSRFGELAAAVEALVELRAVAPGEGLGQGVAHAGPHTALGACSGALPLMAAPAGPLEYAGAPGSGDGGRQGFLEQQQQQQQLGYKGTGEVVAAGDGTPAGEAAVVVAGRAVLGQLLQLQEDTLAALLRKVRAPGHTSTDPRLRVLSWTTPPSPGQLDPTYGCTVPRLSSYPAACIFTSPNTSVCTCHSARQWTQCLQSRLLERARRQYLCPVILRTACRSPTPVSRPKVAVFPFTHLRAAFLTSRMTRRSTCARCSAR